MTTRRAWLIALLTPLGLSAGEDPFRRRWNEFAKSATKWVKSVSRISPASPDFRQAAAALWYECRVSEKFRKLERIVTDWR